MMDTDTLLICIYLLEFDSLIVSRFGHSQISLSLGWAFLFLPFQFHQVTSAELYLCITCY